MKVRAVLVIALGVLLITISAYLIPYGFLLQDNWNKMMIGKLIPFQVDQTEPFTVQMGGIYVHTMIEELKSGFDLQHYFDLNGIKYPFQVSFRDEKLLVSAEIKDKDGNLAAKITDNKWSVNNNPIITHDRNYNSYAFEVIDSDSIPILQVVMAPQNAIFVGGVFYSPNGTLLAMLNGTTILNPRNTDIRDYNQTIFQYPSDSHLEELTLNSPFTFRPTQNSFPPIWVIIIGLVFFAIGTFITSSGVTDKLEEKRHRAKRRKDFIMKSEESSKRKGKREYLNSALTQNLVKELNEYFRNKVEIPRIRAGNRQEIEALISEEALLLARFLRRERETWIPRIASLNMIN